MTKADLQEMLDFSRRKTLELLDSIARRPDPAAIFAWRPGPGRAHIAWQLMHVAATDDRHLHVRMKGGEARNAGLVHRFAGGSVPDDDLPPVELIRRYLTERREELTAHLRGLAESDLATKPNEQAPWTYHEWFKVLAWHEAHHQGQAHLTLNLYRALHEPAMEKVGHSAMRLGILSDTHDQRERTVRAVALLTAAGAEVLIHCGDLTGPGMVEVCGVRPAYFVFGNNDADNVPALRRAIGAIGGTCLDWGGEVELAGKRIAVVHGHLHTDVRRLLAARPDYLLSGHSHIAGDWREEGVRRINPGALYRAQEFSVAVLDLATDRLDFLPVPR